MKDFKMSISRFCTVVFSKVVFSTVFISRVIISKVIISIVLIAFLNKGYADEPLLARMTEYPPVTFYDKKTQKWDGLSVDILKAVTDRADQKLKLLEIPRKRAFALIESGELDIMLNLTQTKEREKHFDFIGLSSYEEMTLIVRKEDVNTPINNLDDFKTLGKKIGIVESYFYPKLSDRSKNDEKFKEEVIGDEVIRSELLPILLNRGNFFGFFEDKLYAINEINNNPVFKGLAIHKYSLNEPQVVHIAMSRKTDESIRNALRVAHQELTKEGVIDKLIDKWVK